MHQSADRATDDGFTREAGRDVDAVLRRLPVLATYSSNMFRLTGVATDAGATQIRRRREEIEMAARLRTPVSNPFGDLAPVEPPESDAVKAAFEAMQAPVTRLVHEAFWVTGDGGSHDVAVTAHYRALQAEAGTASGSSERATSGRDERAEDTAKLWRSALTAWARTLADPAFGQLLARRAVALDDPRVDEATVVALRARLPRRILAPNAVLAVAAAAADDAGAVRRHLAALRESPFDAQDVAEALREACEPVVRAVHDGCAELLRIAADEPSDVPSVAAGLVRDVVPRLRVPSAVLSADDPLPAALHDEVAGVLTRAAVAHSNSGGPAADGLALLAQATAVARAAATVELVARTTRELSDAAMLAVVEPWCSAGDPDGALETLRRWQRRESDPARRAELQRLTADPRAVRAVMAETPVRAVYLGCGVRPFGRRAYADGTWVETRCVTVFWVPVHPVGAYLSDDEFVYARVPMSPWVRRARLLVPVVVALLLLWVFVSWWAALVVSAAVAAVLFGAELLRRREIDAWLDEQVGPAARALR